MYYSPAEYRGSKRAKKGHCSYGRRKGRCLSKKAAASRKKSAIKKLQRAFRSRKR